MYILVIKPSWRKTSFAIFSCCYFLALNTSTFLECSDKVAALVEFYSFKLNHTIEMDSSEDSLIHLEESEDQENNSNNERETLTQFIDVSEIENEGHKFQTFKKFIGEVNLGFKIIYLVSNYKFM